MTRGGGALGVQLGGTLLQQRQTLPSIDRSVDISRRARDAEPPYAPPHLNERAATTIDQPIKRAIGREIDDGRSIDRSIDTNRIARGDDRGSIVYHRMPAARGGRENRRTCPRTDRSALGVVRPRTVLVGEEALFQNRSAPRRRPRRQAPTSGRTATLEGGGTFCSPAAHWAGV